MCIVRLSKYSVLADAEPLLCTVFFGVECIVLTLALINVGCMGFLYNSVSCLNSPCIDYLKRYNLRVSLYGTVLCPSIHILFKFVSIFSIQCVQFI